MSGESVQFTWVSNDFRDRGLASGELGSVSRRCCWPAEPHASHWERQVGRWLMGAIGGMVLALLAYGVLSLLEGWAAFFQRAASPVILRLFTIIMLAGWVMTLWLLRRRRRP
jgi:hypothetical protein